MADKIYYSRGRDVYDITPEQRCAENADQFIEQLITDTATAKKKQYFCAAMEQGEHPRGNTPKEKYPEKFQGIKNWRLSALAAKRRFVSFDCDSFDSPQTFDAMVSYLKKTFKGVLYTTFNYTEDAPRCRFVILLNSEVDRTEGIHVCQMIASKIETAIQQIAEEDLISEWKPVIGWDESVYRAEQQCYLPIVNAVRRKTKTGEDVTDAIIHHLDGELADVANYLAMTPLVSKTPPGPVRQHYDSDSDLDRWYEIDEHTLDDLQAALFSPAMLAISEGGRQNWQRVIAALGSLKNTPYEDNAYQLALEWSEAGGAAFDAVHFESTWDTSRADLTSYKWIFSHAASLGWENPQILRPYLELEKHGFYMTEDGLMKNVEEGKGKAKNIVARKISAPFSVLGLTRDMYSDNWGKLISFKDRDRETKQFIVPDEQLHKSSSDIIPTLSKLGLYISTNMSRGLLEYLNISTARERITLATSTGWFNDHLFVLPESTIGSSTSKVMYQLSGRKKSESSQLTQSGSLEEWQKNISTKCAGNTRLVFSLCVAFAAPLLNVLGVDGGVFSLKGASTKGKSTAQHIAASVWGSGATTGGYSHSCNTTLVGIEVLATAHNDLPLILDELKSVNPKLVGQIAYMLALGQGKARGTKDVTLRETLQWRTLVLASSEDAFESYLKASGERVAAGQQARFVDIPAIVSDENGVFDTLHGSGTAKEFADSLNALTTKYYGCAGISWLEKLTASTRSELVDRLRELITEFKSSYRPDDAGAQLDRVLERFALCAAAGELATEWGITGWDTEESLRCVGECFNAYIDDRGTTGDLEAVNGIERLRSYLSTYSESRFRSSSNDTGSMPISDGYITLSNGKSVGLADFSNESVSADDTPLSRIYWITSDALKDRALDGCNFDITIAALHKKGVLIGVTEETGKNGKSRTVYNPKKRAPLGYPDQRRFYRIDEEKLFE
ncbi:DUF927 domain-containing protein [Xenorhabdus griffiniae]|uniref:DUF927 domain-containing protein n=1 Tax=Xenorhabdus griffiniae TaxID=351672 RepID=A0ABY9XKI7_9GAMM|nr:DUF927 domain-containing protein [Xenorhabdus griffiniae]MBD1228586.1 DUF927 domain-containing protein [Xenorhabdus griffiniae]MBE8588677.1 DUF927 domain-containing protein [Xenorhabdus griffiniae]WMV73455.1 DUF927 domain-containing protein [Xenorhabdus griffiniae]WNH03134.1 DUF927 domain-containing protein [Xenorhabdus griffiniae]